jgi:hypothetical protein
MLISHEAGAAIGSTMNWKLILQLSMFGLAMGLATVFLIPPNAEPAFWLVIYLVSAYLIAKRTTDGRYTTGVMVGIANSIWITAAHLALFDPYLARHPQEAQMMGSIPISPTLFMLTIGPIVGVFSGAVIGVLALVIGKLIIRKGVPASESMAVPPQRR